MMMLVFVVMGLFKVEACLVMTVGEMEEMGWID